MTLYLVIITTTPFIYLIYANNPDDVIDKLKSRNLYVNRYDRIEEVKFQGDFVQIWDGLKGK